MMPSLVALALLFAADPEPGPSPLTDERPPIVVKTAVVSVDGGLDQKTVHTYVRRYAAALRWCYEAQNRDGGLPVGTMSLSWRVSPNGNVLSPRIGDDSIGHKELRTCVVTKVSRWRFPNPKDGAPADVKLGVTFVHPAAPLR